MPRASAVVPGQPNAEPIVIHSNHTDMVRYGSKKDSNYCTVSDELQIMAGGAPELIRRRWETERKINEGKSMRLISHRSRDN